MTKFIGEQSDGKPPQVVLDEWMRKAGPSIKDPTLPRYWYWGGAKHYATLEDAVDD